ncbi:hypothetical protein ABW21_db0205782 [Orbilia brochopaga]|nr:hypothetical protein ABW21_db0205782 [Drechslerella brochopaga]
MSTVAVELAGDRIVVFLKLRKGTQETMQPVELYEGWTLAVALEKINKLLYEIGYIPATTLATCDIHFDGISARELVMLLSRTQQPQETLLVGHVFYGTELLDVQIPTDDSTVTSEGASTPNVSDDELTLAGMKLTWIHARNERLRAQTGNDGSGELSAVVFVGMDEFRMAVVKRYVYAYGIGRDDFNGGRKVRGCGRVVQMDEQGGRCVVQDASTETQRILKYRPRRGQWIEELEHAQ